MVRGGRWLTLLGVCVIPCAIAAGWAGCATADEEVEGTPKKNPGTDAIVSDGEDPDDGGDEDGTSGDGGSKDGGNPSLCGDASTPNSCASAVDVGKIALGAKKTVLASVPVSGGDLWFKITYESLDDRRAHPRVQITPDSTPLAFQVMKNCAAEEFTCGDEPGTKSSKIHDFEMQYRPEGGVVDAPKSDAAADTSVGDSAPQDTGGGGPGPVGDGGGGDAADAFIPIKLGTAGVIYVRVFRPAGSAPGCDFKLEVSN